MLKQVYIAKTATVVGDVFLENEVSVWYSAVLRGDENSITIGERTNIQDNCTVHVGYEYEVRIGKDVTIGHNSVIHGCIIGDETMVGMGSIVMNGARIGKHCIIGAGSLVTENMEVPDGSIVFGAPARIIRPMTRRDILANLKSSKEYVIQAQEFLPCRNVEEKEA